MWKLLGRLTGKRQDGGPLTCLTYGGTTLKKNILAELQAGYYQDKLVKIAREVVGDGDEGRSDPLGLLREAISTWDGRHNQISLILRAIKAQELDKLMKELKPTHTEGRDDISSSILHTCRTVIIVPLLGILNRSLVEGKFPDLWKEKTMKPLYKGKGDIADPKSYRPISLIPAASKLLEKSVLIQLAAYLQKRCCFTHNTMHIYKKSTVTTLITMWDYVEQLGEEDTMCTMVILDLSAAFDCI